MLLEWKRGWRLHLPEGGKRLFHELARQITVLGENDALEPKEVGATPKNVLAGGDVEGPVISPACSESGGASAKEVRAGWVAGESLNE
jgi:hypothetical protein